MSQRNKPPVETQLSTTQGGFLLSDRGFLVVRCELTWVTDGFLGRHNNDRTIGLTLVKSEFQCSAVSLNTRRQYVTEMFCNDLIDSWLYFCNDLIDSWLYVYVGLLLTNWNASVSWIVSLSGSQLLLYTTLSQYRVDVCFRFADQFFLIDNQLEILKQNCYSFSKVYFHHWSYPLLSVTSFVVASPINRGRNINAAKVEAFVLRKIHKISEAFLSLISAERSDDTDLLVKVSALYMSL